MARLHDVIKARSHLNSERGGHTPDIMCSDIWRGGKSRICVRFVDSLDDVCRDELFGHPGRFEIEENKQGRTVGLCNGLTFFL